MPINFPCHNSGGYSIKEVSKNSDKSYSTVGKYIVYSENVSSSPRKLTPPKIPDRTSKSIPPPIPPKKMNLREVDLFKLLPAIRLCRIVCRYLLLDVQKIRPD